MIKIKYKEPGIKVKELRRREAVCALSAKNEDYDIKNHDKDEFEEEDI